jgi:RimJ/RimL family protein N-acetyltransferase
MTNEIKFESERLLFRDYRLSDWETVHDYSQRADILIYEAWGPNDETETKNFIKTVQKNQTAQPRTSFDFAIILKEEKKLIGGCHFEYTTEDQTDGNIGYIIHPDYWRMGYACESTNALMDYMATLSDLSTVKATCDVLNKASQRVLEKCGLKLKNKIEQDFLMKGRYRDTYVYEKLMQ